MATELIHRYKFTNSFRDAVGSVDLADPYLYTEDPAELPGQALNRQWNDIVRAGDTYYMVTGDVGTAAPGRVYYVPVEGGVEPQEFPGQTVNRYYYGLCAVGEILYLTVAGGRVYELDVNVSGDPTELSGQTVNRDWIKICTDGTKLFATVYGGRVYERDISTPGDFTELSGQTVSRNYFGIDTDGTSLFVSVTPSDKIYTRRIDTAGDFVQVSGAATTRNYSAVRSDGKFLYAWTGPGRLYFRTADLLVSGDFVELPDQTTNRTWGGGYVDSTGVLLSVVKGGKIYFTAQEDWAEFVASDVPESAYAKGGITYEKTVEPTVHKAPASTQIIPGEQGMSFSFWINADTYYSGMVAQGYQNEKESFQVYLQIYAPYSYLSVKLHYVDGTGTLHYIFSKSSINVTTLLSNLGISDPSGVPLLFVVSFDPSTGAEGTITLGVYSPAYGLEESVLGNDIFGAELAEMENVSFTMSLNPVTTFLGAGNSVFFDDVRFYNGPVPSWKVQQIALGELDPPHPNGGTPVITAVRDGIFGSETLRKGTPVSVAGNYFLATSVCTQIYGNKLTNGSFCDVDITGWDLQFANGGSVSYNPLVLGRSFTVLDGGSTADLTNCLLVQENVPVTRNKMQIVEFTAWSDTYSKQVTVRVLDLASGTVLSTRDFYLQPFPQSFRIPVFNSGVFGTPTLQFAFGGSGNPGKLCLQSANWQEGV